MPELVDGPKEGNAEEVTTPQNDIPDAFRGKEFADVVKMYQSLEQKMGQQSEELGSLRKLADQTLMSPQASSKADDLADLDFYSDPEEAVRRIVDRQLQPYQSIAAQQIQAQTAQRLSSEFPDWKETVKDPSFADWVAKSKVRKQLFSLADNADYDAASELFSTWNELQGVKADKQSLEKTAVQRDRKLRAATTEKGANQIDPRKILKRADLRDLKQKNPSRYNDLLPDIRRAYAEGRVR